MGRKNGINTTSDRLSLKALWYDYRKSARRRNLEFTLSLDDFEFITSSNCEYCGLPAVRVFNDYGRFKTPYLCNGIDRVNNELGYTKENCVACCKECNFAKGRLAQSEFYEWIRRIVAHQKNMTLEY